ncbi:MAG: undecaprenyl-diphosphate phosphatase [Gammaproteobacteria bacterium]|nr:undecaprenyl-diphosphate phosphatase [Gammaproteobacteria bacterium]MYK44951.1 undecaprenyl-diphosphate phosphatase [Gammaproteobacteria bacterium]
MESSLSLLQLVVLALVQGITEFLPVSSSAHLILPAALTDWPDQGLAFDVAVHFGTLVAVTAYFRRDLAGFARSGVALAMHRRWDDKLDLLAKVGIATIPVVIVGLFMKPVIEAHLRTTTIIAAATIVFGIALWLADRHRGERITPSYFQATLIGLAQAVALVPGTSRSGITIAAALALGLARPAAARFSFLLSIPAIAGAAIYTVLDAGPDTPLPWMDLGLGFALAGASAFVCIAAFIRFVERIGMTPFVIYRVVLGVALLALA